MGLFLPQLDILFFFSYCNNGSYCQTTGMGDTDANLFDTHTLGLFRRSTAQAHFGSARRVVDRFDVRPRDTAAPAGAQQLHHRFFHREPTRPAFALLSVFLTVLTFRTGKYPL